MIKMNYVFHDVQCCLGSLLQYKYIWKKLLLNSMQVLNVCTSTEGKLYWWCTSLLNSISIVLFSTIKTDSTMPHLCKETFFWRQQDPSKCSVAEWQRRVCNVVSRLNAEWCICREFNAQLIAIEKGSELGPL